MKCELDSACRAEAIYRVTWKITSPNGLPLQTANACAAHGEVLHDNYLKPHHASAEALVWYEEPCKQSDSRYFTTADADSLAAYEAVIKAKQRGEKPIFDYMI